MKTPWFYHVVRVLIVFLLKLLARWQVRGRKNVPRNGPLLVVSNHMSLVDPPLLGVSLGRKTFFMAKEELFKSKVNAYFIRSFGAFPVHRGRLDRKALEQAGKALSDGASLVMFPEGMRSMDGRLRPGFNGAAMIAAQNNVSILPVGITGTEKIKGTGWIVRRPTLKVNIGEPFALDIKASTKLTKEELDRLTLSIMEKIAGLLPPEYRGHYA